MHPVAHRLARCQHGRDSVDGNRRGRGDPEKKINRLSGAHELSFQESRQPTVTRSIAASLRPQPCDRSCVYGLLRFRPVRPAPSAWHEMPGSAFSEPCRPVRAALSKSLPYSGWRTCADPLLERRWISVRRERDSRSPLPRSGRSANAPWQMNRTPRRDHKRAATVRESGIPCVVKRIWKTVSACRCHAPFRGAASCGGPFSVSDRRCSGVGGVYRSLRLIKRSLRSRVRIPTAFPAHHDPQG